MGTLRAVMEQPPRVEWQRDQQTGEDLVHVPDVCGSFWWAQLHSWAENIHEWGCTDCGGFAIRAATALHDVVNWKLGKPVQHRENLQWVAQVFGAAASGRQYSDITAANRVMTDIVSGVGLGLGFAVANVIVGKAKNTGFFEQDVMRQSVSEDAIKLDISGDGEYVSERLKDPGDFHPDSFRTRVEGEHAVVFACPPDEWKAERCEAAMSAVAILHPRQEEAELVSIARDLGIPIMEGDQVLDHDIDTARTLTEVIA